MQNTELLYRYLELSSSEYSRKAYSGEIRLALQKLLQGSSALELGRAIENIDIRKLEVFVSDLRKHKLIGAPADKTVRTIIVCTDQMSNGGVERALSNIMPVWVNAGFRIILVTNQEATAEDYPIPAEVVRYAVDAENIFEYIERLRSIIRKENADGIFVQKIEKYHYYYLNLLAGDEKTVFFAEYHTSFAMQANSLSKNFTDVPHYLRLADRSVSLSRCNQYFFSMLGIKSYYIPNKAQFQLNQAKPPKPAGSPFEIVWVGRPADYIKQLEQGIKILNSACRKNPGLHMTVVGDFDRVNPKNKTVLKLVKKYHLEKHITFAGYQQDVTPFYRNADILLSTSMVEGYPMTFLEAFSFGLPILLFDLPYLDLIQDGGVITVPQLDTESAADAIVHLANTPELLKRLSAEAANAFLKAEQFDFKKAWTDFFTGQECNQEQSPDFAKRQTAAIIQTWYNETAIARSRFIRLMGSKKFIRTWSHTPELHVLLIRSRKKELAESEDFKVFIRNCSLLTKISVLLKMYGLYPAFLLRWRNAMSKK